MRRMAMVLMLLAAAACGRTEEHYRPQEAPTPAKSVTAQAEPTGEGFPPGEQIIDIGEGLRVRVEWPANPDPLLKVMVDQYVGTRQAVVEGKRGYKRNLEIDAEAQATEWVNELIDQERSMRGTGRIYNLRVSARMGRGAQIDACVDESKVRLVSSRTGEVVSPHPDWTRPYAESVAAHHGDDGVWRIRSYLTPREGCTR
ncbi:hypothetical protein ETD86_43395 [Nonomuraea turkmeniaca]|uniref:Lipoprotein n=1 Tax=Nonomuraea turkmeniaca TaxID=103838 RepID=A0A5S4FK64_9ACTN|nr:hypothetical protein [Nonomuraea turkmeniaca]TMR09487.1 hypothetical protein ETD86_43395 [Nonomuraea turkmeniaca]